MAQIKQHVGTENILEILDGAEKISFYKKTAIGEEIAKIDWGLLTIKKIDILNICHRHLFSMHYFYNDKRNI